MTMTITEIHILPQLSDLAKLFEAVHRISSVSEENDCCQEISHTFSFYLRQHYI